jgi:hypothetical protein
LETFEGKTCGTIPTTKESFEMKSFRSLFLFALLLLPCSNTFAVELVKVSNIKDNVDGTYKDGELKEGGKFYHDREYTITHIPKQFLGLTHLLVSADCPGGKKWKLTFEIDRPAFLYMAWDSRHKRPEDRGQNPKGWVRKGFKDTGKVLFLDAPHAPTEYWIYKSIEPYPKGQVVIPGIDEVVGDPMLMWTVFLEAE